MIAFVKRLIAALAALTCTTAPLFTVPPGAYPELCEPARDTVILDFDSNITTGYEWNAKILQGDSVSIDESASGYVSDPNPEMMDGVGGTTYFKLNALRVGDTYIRFVYSRGTGDGFAITALASVNEDRVIRIYNITEVVDGLDRNQ